MALCSCVNSKWDEELSSKCSNTVPHTTMNLKSFPLAPCYRYFNRQKQDQCFRAGDISEADNKDTGKGMVNGGHKISLHVFLFLCCPGPGSDGLKGLAWTEVEDLGHLKTQSSVKYLPL